MCIDAQHSLLVRPGNCLVLNGGRVQVDGEEVKVPSCPPPPRLRLPIEVKPSTTFTPWAADFELTISNITIHMGVY